MIVVKPHKSLAFNKLLTMITVNRGMSNTRSVGGGSYNAHKHRVMTTTGVTKFIQGWFCTRVARKVE